MRNQLISLAIVGATYLRSGIQDPGSGIQDLGWPESLRGGQGRTTISQLPINRPMAALLVVVVVVVVVVVSSK